ncbi:thiol reductant ABC exporter subunit CydD [Conexibacter sp. SYSU D00693]|uniref:thiol reductant ABC exporter subunit CydD n=1 Tax=Conexibacter sp. SYSU D00693 TaxID=2812560 RepID=UPI00196B784A|nr:thiol reductant ABC exporter subunit CydD [Conexibacter sp. SYSU D00693]
MRATDRRLLREGRAARHAVLAIGALGVLAAGLVVAQALLLAHLLFEGFLGHRAIASLTPTVLALLGVVAARAVVVGAFELVGRLGALRVLGELRGRLASHLLSGAPLAAAGERSGELATVAVQGVDALEAWFSKYLPQVVLSVTIPVAVLAVVLPRDLAAGLVLALTIPVLIVFLALVGLLARDKVRARFDALQLLGAHFSDVVRGLPTLRAHVRERAQERTIAAIGERYRAETMATLRVAFLSAFVLELGATVGTALVAATVGIQLVEGHVGLEAGLAVLLLCPELYAPIRAMGQQHHAAEEGTAAAERLYAVLDRPAIAPAPARPVPAPDPSRLPVRLDGVRFAHPAREGDVLHDLDLEVAPGEVTALVGASGAGKSTVAALVLRLADPDGGAVRCGDTDLRDVDPDAWRAQVAWVPQRPMLFAGTLADDVRLLRPEATDEEVAAALKAAGAGDLVAELPDGLATRIGDGGRGLSAGQAQRVALARAFCAERPLVVLDEPTAHLDAQTAARVDAAIARLAEGRTVLLVVHRPELAARAHTVVRLDGGRCAPAVLEAVAA